MAHDMAEATGTFEVTLVPAEPPGPVNRLSITKRYAGGLVATGVGEMLSAGDPRRGSAGYVAIEQVTGTLDGRQGSFAFQHSGTMAPGRETLAITVVPGSTMGDLAGLTGDMHIERVGGGHRYLFRYHLP